VLLGLMGLLVLSNVMVALAPNFATILLGRVLLGIGVGGFWAIGVAIGPRLVKAEDAVRASSYIFAGVSFGTVAGVPAGTLIGDLMGWRMAFAAAAAVPVLVLVMQALLLPSVPPLQPIRWGHLPALLGVPKARLGLLATLLLFIGQFAAYTYITPFLIQVAGMGGSAVTGLLLAYGVTGFAGNLIGGWAAARDVRLSLVVTALTLSTSTLLLPVLGDGPVGATILVAIWGFAFGALPISIQTWMFRAAPQALETGAALFVSTAQVALGGGALVGGLAVDHLGVPSAMVLGGGFTLATAALIWLRGR
jgi:predicted MFS family arabinose efflux permease